MPTSRTGSDSKKRDLLSFTLIELLIVLSIISIVFFIVTPKFIGSINPRKNKSFMMKLRNTLLYLNEKAIIKKEVYLFIFDLDERSYYFRISEAGNPEGMVRDRFLIPVKFPAGLKIAGVKVIPGGDVTEGRCIIPFTPGGMLYSFEIAAGDKSDNYLILSGNSINGRIELRTVKSDEFNGKGDFY